MTYLSWRERNKASQPVENAISFARTVFSIEPAEAAYRKVVAAAAALPPEMHQLRREAALFVIDSALPGREAMRSAAELLEKDIQRQRALIERAKLSIILGGLTSDPLDPEDDLQKRVLRTAERLIRRLAKIHPDEAHELEKRRREGCIGRLQSKDFTSTLSERLGVDFKPTDKLMLRKTLERCRRQKAPPFGSPGFTEFYTIR